MKHYIAKSQVSFTVKYPNGSTKRISFAPKTLGGSTYVSDDEDEQKALESHPAFGRLFKLDKIADAPVVKTPAPIVKQDITSIDVTDLSDARNYLAERFGISRTKLRSKASVLEYAKTYNISFVGLPEE